MQFLCREIDRNVMLVEVDGGLDATTSAQFTDALEKMIDVGIDRIIVDCDRLHYVSSAGIATLLRLHKRMHRRGGEVKLASVRGLVFDVLRAMKLDEVFNVYADVERARLALRPRDDGNDRRRDDKAGRDESS